MDLYLIIWHCKHVTEATSTDVICDLIAEFEGVLERSPTHSGHIGTRKARDLFHTSTSFNLKDISIIQTIPSNVYLEAGKLGLKVFLSLVKCLQPAPLSPALKKKKKTDLIYECCLL